MKGFGRRVRAIRQQRGLTQEELGKAVKVSNRVIAYYKSDGAQPPGPLLAERAKVLRVSADELLGLRPLRDDTPLRTARLLRRLRQVEQLALADQRAVLKLVDALAATRCPGTS